MNSKLLKSNKENIIKLEFNYDKNEVNHAQLRLVKTIHSLLVHVLVAEEENEYFEASSELLGLCSAVIKQSNFPKLNSKEKIPYGEQAIEYSLEKVLNQIEKDNLIKFDN